MGQQTVGKYRILDRIASGTQGAVFRAFDPESQRIVALKVLHPSLIQDATYIERFHREATLTASVDHPNVVVIYEVGSDGDQHYIALEFLPESLHGLIESGALPVANAAGLAAGIADGLGAVHKLGIVHRDMKPQNVLITPDGTPKVTDFGIARGEALPTMTATGMIMGTPYYMSPEQAEGHRVDARTDVYALGCVLYQMLSGEVPFSGDTPFSVIRKHIEQMPRPIRTIRGDVPQPLADVIAKAMSKSPDDRYVDGAEMAQAIRVAVPGVRSVAVTPPRTAADTADLPPADQPPVSARTYLPPPGRPRQLFLMVSGAVVVAIVAALAAAIILSGGNGSSSVPSSVAVAPTATPVPAPTLAPAFPLPTATSLPAAPTLVPTVTIAPPAPIPTPTMISVAPTPTAPITPPVPLATADSVVPLAMPTPNPSSTPIPTQTPISAPTLGSTETPVPQPTPTSIAIVTPNPPPTGLRIEVTGASAVWTVASERPAPSELPPIDGLGATASQHSALRQWLLSQPDVQLPTAGSLGITAAQHNALRQWLLTKPDAQLDDVPCWPESPHWASWPTTTAVYGRFHCLDRTFHRGEHA